jgi:hypothetical protein
MTPGYLIHGTEAHHLSSIQAIKERIMTQNVGGIERIIRIIAGLAILTWGFLLSDPINWWGAIGAVPLGTGLIAYCPLWTVFGINTKKAA